MVVSRKQIFTRHSQRDQPEGRPGSGHHGHNNRWKETEGIHAHTAIHPPIQWEPQTRGLEGYGSSPSAPSTPQRSIPLEHGQQEVQPSFTLGRPGRILPEGMSQRDTPQISYGKHQRMESQQEVQTPGGNRSQDKAESSHHPSYRRATEPEREYSYSFRFTRSRPTQLSSGFTPFRHQQISGQESPFFTVPGTFQEKTRFNGQEQDFFQPKAERVIPNDTEAVELAERSTQEPKIVVNTSNTIKSPATRNITPTQMEHSGFTPESNIKSD
ncbi:hypothetical protein O181_012205 [Austropuccinia psidii MF-1]|uniref:Uncharacterized protein n=1 Tax=Austropuccinia psidii MF-1 TaxID=1389203 RepID=A0A9Q3BWN0_9BASI|nr:hypothetical protein [Austropuccinia psidii MF-1]